MDARSPKTKVKQWTELSRSCGRGPGPWELEDYRGGLMRLQGRGRLGQSKSILYIMVTSALKSKFSQCCDPWTYIFQLSDQSLHGTSLYLFSFGEHQIYRSPEADNPISSILKKRRTFVRKCIGVLRLFMQFILNWNMSVMGLSQDTCLNDFFYFCSTPSRVYFCRRLFT